MTLSDPQSGPPSGSMTLRPRLSSLLGLPQLTRSPFWHAVLTTPVVATGAFPASSLPPWPSPVLSAGRLPRLHFRGLLKLHACYGLSDCSPT